MLESALNQLMYDSPKYDIHHLLHLVALTECLHCHTAPGNVSFSQLLQDILPFPTILYLTYVSGLHRVSSHPTFRPSMTWIACNYHRIYWASGTQVLSRAHRGATILPLYSTADCGSCAEREHSCHGAWAPPFPVPPIPTLTISSIHAWDRSTHRCAHHCGCSGI